MDLARSRGRRLCNRPRTGASRVVTNSRPMDGCRLGVSSLCAHGAWPQDDMEAKASAAAGHAEQPPGSHVPVIDRPHGFGLRSSPDLLE